MVRPLSLLLASAIAVSVPALSVAPAAAEMQGGIQLIGGHGGDWSDRRDGWRGGWDNDNWRWGHRRHHRDRDFRPGFSFSFGVPFPRYSYYQPRRSRDCYREWDGSVYCRAY